MAPKSEIPAIAVSVGDPASIASEVFLKSISDFLKLKEFDHIKIEVFGSRKSCELSEPQLFRDILECPRISFEASVEIEGDLKLGQGSSVTAKCAIENLSRAAHSCLESDRRALVTGPVDKKLCSEVHSGFSGQTGFLKTLTQSTEVTMMLASTSLRVALVTTHLPLSAVSQNLSQESILSCIKNVVFYLQSFLERPKIGVLGLNPHASDQGLFGSEEQEIIEPSLRSAERLFPVSISGPLSPDTAFLKRNEFDAFVCMYHDQGLIPLKLLAFDEAINLSLGLPFLRTSVDHGTAFDIAGLQKASDKSFFQALVCAAHQIKNPSPQK